jgi:hypothetical protein
MKGVGILVFVTLCSCLFSSALEEGPVLIPSEKIGTSAARPPQTCCNPQGLVCGFGCFTGSTCCGTQLCCQAGESCFLDSLTNHYCSAVPSEEPSYSPTIVSTSLLPGTSSAPSPAPTDSPECCVPGRFGCVYACDAASCCGQQLCCQAGEHCYQSEDLTSLRNRYYCSATPRPTKAPSYSPSFLPTTSPSPGKPSLRPSPEPSLPPVPPPTPEPTVSFEPTPVAPMPAPSYRALCCNPTYLGGGAYTCGVYCVAELTGTCCGTSNKCCQGTCKYDHNYGYSYCKAAPKTSTSSPISSPTTGGGNGGGESHDDENNGGDSSSYSNEDNDDDSGPSSAIIAVSVVIPLLFVMSVAACAFCWIRKHRYGKLTQDPVSVSSASSPPGIEIAATVVQPAAAEERDIVVVVPAVILDSIYPSIGAQEETLGEVVNPSKPYYERRVKL